MEKVNAKDYLGKEVSIEIDRPLGTRHPKHGFMYMINYGYIPNTVSGDGEELDAYLVGEFEPVEKSSGKVMGGKGKKCLFTTGKRGGCHETCWQ